MTSCDIIGRPTFTEGQLHRFAALVKNELHQLDPTIRAPKSAEFHAKIHYQISSLCSLSVDIDLGFTVLTVRQERPYGMNTYYEDDYLPMFAKQLRNSVEEALHDDYGKDELNRLEKVIRAKIKRGKLDVQLVTVRFAPKWFGYTESTRKEYWVRVRLLDDVLRPTVGIICQNTGRKISKELSFLGERQAVRLAAARRLSPVGGILEIDSVAEHALAATGHDLGDAVQKIMNSDRKPQHSVTIWGDTEDGEHLDVVCRDGCLQLEGSVKPIWWKSNQEVQISATFPESITFGLAGRSLSNVVDHPLFKGDAKIAYARRRGNTTVLTLENASRPIVPEEFSNVALRQS